MKDVLRFYDINEFVRKTDLGVVAGNSDFLVYSFDHVKHESFEHLSAYRQNYFEINIEVSKGCSFSVDQFNVPSEENRLTLISPHRLQKIQPSTKKDPTTYKGYGIFFTPEFIGFDTTSTKLLKDFPFLNRFSSPTIILEKTEMANIVDIVRKIHYEYSHYQSYTKEIIKNYLNILFLKAKQNYQGSHRPSGSINRDQEIYQEYELLVQENFLETTSIRAYAHKINISPKHLSETVKKISGNSALHLIHQARLNYAKALLLQTGKSVSEIAYELNFENPDYFSAFFKRLTGKPPTQYRVN